MRIKKQQRKLKMKFWVRLHSIFTLALFLLYVTLGTIGGFDVLGKDIQKKYALASTTISVYVNGPPGKPVVLAMTSCEDEISTVSLNWEATEDTAYYDITRNGVLLVSGLNVTSYIDGSVVGDATYQYVVTAVRSALRVNSEPVSLKAQNCGEVLPSPKCEVVTFNGEPIISGKRPITRDRTPIIIGTTNIPNAIIKIETLPGPSVVATVHANENGYWSYAAVADLEIGKYSFRITATDPLDALRKVTIEQPFQIIRQADEKDKDTGNPKPVVNYPSQPQPPVVENNSENEQQPEASTPEKPVFSFVVSVTNKDGVAFFEQGLDVLLNFDKSWDSKKMEITYEVINAQEKVVFAIGSAQEKISGNKFEKKISLPQTLPFGDYTIRIKTQDNGTSIMSQAKFSFAEKPFINFGGGIKITYSQLIDKMGWVFVTSLIILLVLGFALLLEYHFYQKSIFTVAEENLIRSGMISKRKEVHS